MPLIKDGHFVADPWRWVEGDAAVPPSGDVVLPLARLREEGAAILAAGSRLGVEIPPDTDLATIEKFLSRLAMIAIVFPGFADGRGFSLAHRLRLAGFSGEIRARGPLIADQAAFALSCGFDTIEIPDAIAARQPESSWRDAARAISVGYQRGYDGPRNILEARRAARLIPPAE